MSIPVSEKGIEYVSDITGTGGPDAFDVKGDKVYVVDNAHHRLLIYNRISGEYIEDVYVLIPSKENVYVLKVVHWQSADEFIRELEGNHDNFKNSPGGIILIAPPIICHG